MLKDVTRKVDGLISLLGSCDAAHCDVAFLQITLSKIVLRMNLIFYPIINIANASRPGAILQLYAPNLIGINEIISKIEPF